MRTTIELNESLFRRAKMVAVQRKMTLKRLITKALERELDTLEDSGERRMVAPPIGLDIAPKVPALTNAEIASLQDDEDLEKGSARP